MTAHKVLASWNENTITWNNKPPCDNTITSYQAYGTSDSEAWSEFRITDIVKQWYSNGNNYGLMLKQQETDNSVSYWSFNFYNSSYRPMLEIYYTSGAGLENYWTFHAQSVGRAGVGYINDNNGNLVFVHNTLTMNGNRLPLSIDHVYNSCDKDSINGCCGSGWKTTYDQSLTWQLISGTSYYIYIDADNTRHYFIDGKDQSGLGRTLTSVNENGNSYNVIKDKSGNKLYFGVPTSVGVKMRLGKIKDANENCIVLSYGQGNITSITDGAGRIINFIYSNGKLSSIVDPSSRITSFTYTNNQLTRITYPDNLYSTYTYDSYNRLKAVTNYDGYKVSYTYNTTAPYRVVKATENHTNGTLGNELNITYGNKKTTFTDVTGKKATYKFNSSGNTANIIDFEGNAQYFKYLSGNAVNNKISLESKLQTSIINKIKNHNAEYDLDWNSSYWSGSSGTCSYATDQKYLANRSLKITKTNSTGRHFFEQQINLVKGKTYTLSGFIKTNSISSTSNKGAVLWIDYQDSSGTWQTKLSPYVKGTNDWERYEASFTLPSNAATETVNIRVALVEESGTAYFDCIQLEEGSLANRYNLIENCDFSYFSGCVQNYWGGAQNNDLRVIDSTSVDHPVKCDKKCLEINEYYYAYEKTQTINISGKKGDVYTLSSWVKSNGFMRWPTSLYILMVFNGANQTECIFANEDDLEWQFLAGRMVAKNDYTSITVKLLYGPNYFSTAWFDGVQLFKEEFGQSYQYDTNGNLIATTDLTSQAYNFLYGWNNDLVKYTSPKGNAYLYSYDDKHNMLTSTTPENVMTTYTYNNYGNQTTAKVGDTVAFISSSTAYTTNGNYINTVTDPSGNTITYNYNQTKGVLDSFVDAKNKTTSYSYDSNLNRLSSVSKTAGGQQVTNSYGYENDRIKSITHNGFSYSFNYDSLGNNTQVLVGSQPLATNTYEARTSKLLTTVFGNGQGKEYVYDTLDRIKAIKIGGVEKFKYLFDASGNLGYHEDLINDVNYRYLYDMAERPAVVKDSLGNKTSYEYDIENNVSKIKEKIGSNTYSTSYEYDKDNRLKKVTAHNNRYTTYAYDTLNRLSSMSVNTGSFNYNTALTYLAGANGSSTYRLGTITNNGSAISYTYDANGNIETITQSGLLIRYYYNELNEVIRENNQVLNKTITYAYDVGGNITNKTEYPYTTGTPGTPTKTYSYGYDTTWKDKLTSFDGKAITYDQIGNPLTYDGNTYTWEMGRQLTAINKTGLNATYKYNDQGIRTSKTINGVTTNYHLLGNQVTYESNGTDSIYYSYDANNRLISMNLNGTEYYYIRNGQSDIIGLFDSAGTRVVTYTYDTWGKLISTTGSLASTVGIKNPYRYRGYRYDSETGYYYCQSRYYVPEWGRWLNADSNLGNPGELLTHNLFAYCANNPVMYVDPNGDVFMLITGAIGLVGGAVVGGIIAAKTGKNVWAGIGIGAAAGAAIGLTCGAAAAVIATGTATASTGAVIAGLSAGVTTAAGATGAAVYKTLEKGVNFTQTTLQRMQNPNRFVPVQTLIEAIKNGVAKPDPQGTKAIMYTIEMFRNGKAYQLEVLYDKATNTILHFLYK